jgi:hypothetical protein
MVGEMQDREIDVGEVVESKEESVDWQGFVEAVNTFRDDYGIVGHTGEVRVGFFDEPRTHGEYTVSGREVDEMGEYEFRIMIKEKPLVVAMICMDKRGARLSYEKMKEIAAGEGLENVNIFLLAMGGGVIQRDRIRRDGEEVVVNRGNALESILFFVEQNAQVKLVIATDHDHRCGVEAYVHDGQGWPEILGCEPGGNEEASKMKELITEYAGRNLPSSWKEQGIVRKFLVRFSDDWEKDPSVFFDTID